MKELTAKPLNWHWLEDLLVTAGDLEVRAFGLAHSEEIFFAACLEYDGLEGSLAWSFGTRDAVEAVVAAADPRTRDDLCYRAVELQPENWEYRRMPVQDPEGLWDAPRRLLDQYREIMNEDLDPEVAEFYWLRFEYLAESVVQRMLERGSFRYLNREGEFLAYAYNEHETLEELEDRLARFFPGYRPATMEFVEHPRLGELPAHVCAGRHGRERLSTLTALGRCTACQKWYCPRCSQSHHHPELRARRSFFKETG